MGLASLGLGTMEHVLGMRHLCVLWLEAAPILRGVVGAIDSIGLPALAAGLFHQ